MKMPILRMPFKSGGSEGFPAPAPRVEASLPKTAPIIDIQRQATRDLVGRVQAVAGTQGEEAGLAAIVDAHRAPENALETVPPGPDRWEQTPRTSVDSAAIQDMSAASAQHTQEQGLVGNEAVTNVDATSVPPVEKPRVRFGPGGMTEVPSAANTTTAPVESAVPPVGNVQGTESATSTVNVEQIKKTVEQVLTKTNPEYAAITDPKARAEYLQEAVDITIRSQSVEDILSGDYDSIAKIMAEGGPVSQSDIVRYTVDTTLRFLMNKDTEGILSTLPNALKNHPELVPLLVHAAKYLKSERQLGELLSARDESRLLKAGNESKNLFIVILMVLLSLATSTLKSGLGGQEQH